MDHHITKWFTISTEWRIKTTETENYVLYKQTGETHDNAVYQNKLSIDHEVRMDDLESVHRMEPSMYGFYELTLKTAVCVRLSVAINEAGRREGMRYSIHTKNIKLEAQEAKIVDIYVEDELTFFAVELQIKISRQPPVSSEQQIIRVYLHDRTHIPSIDFFFVRTFPPGRFY